MELKIDQLSKSYSNRFSTKLFPIKASNTENSKNNIEPYKAIDQVSFTLTEGIYGLMGPNGAGKTTLINMLVGNLNPDSGGMKQRLLIAQAILNDPDILILDEPTAGVDPNERIRLRNLISRISFQKIVIFATHVVSDIEFISNEFLMLQKGKLLYQDNHENLVNLMVGKVFESVVEPEVLEKLDREYTVVSMLKDKSNIRVRFIADDSKGEYKGKEVEPSLEDLYIYLNGSSM